MPLDDIKYAVDVIKKRVITGIAIRDDGAILVNVEELYSYQGEVLKNVPAAYIYTDAESGGLASQIRAFVESKINEINTQDKTDLEKPKVEPAPIDIAPK